MIKGWFPFSNATGAGQSAGDRSSGHKHIHIAVVLEELFAPDLVPKTSGGIFVRCERVFFGRNGFDFAGETRSFWWCDVLYCVRRVKFGS